MNERFHRIYIDTWWDQIYRSGKRARYRSDLVFEHLHPEIYPENEDALFRRNSKWESVDKAIWNSTENQRDLKSAIRKFRCLALKTTCKLLLEKIRNLSGFLMREKFQNKPQTCSRLGLVIEVFIKDLVGRYSLLALKETPGLSRLTLPQEGLIISYIILKA